MLKTLLMATLTIGATPLAAQTTTAPAVATTPAVVSVKHNDMIVAADGKRIGTVDMVRQGRAMILRDGSYVSVPLASLSQDGSRYKTSLTIKELGSR